MFRAEKKSPGDIKVVGVLGTLDELLGALRAAKEKKLRIETVYAPVPHHEIAEALGFRGLSSVRIYTLAGGILGGLTGIGLTLYTCAQWMFIVGGKPPLPAVPTVIVAFEFTILMAVLFTVAGLLINGRLPKFKLSGDYDHRFSEGHFGVVVLCAESDRENAERILAESGAGEIHEVRE